MKINSLIILFLFFTFCSFAQEDNDAICITPSKQDVSLYKQRMDTFNEYIFGLYGFFYPEDEDFFLYRMLFYAHYDDYKYFHGTLLDLTGKKLGLKNNPISFSLFEYVAQDNIYQNVVIHHKLSRMERCPEEHWRWEDIYTRDVHTYKNILPLPASSSLDSLKIKIINNIEIKSYNDYIANYQEDKDRLILTLYMMYATRCELSYKVMCDYISAKYGYRNPELVSRVISELTMQRERLGPYYLELLQDEYLCEDTAKHAQVNKYIFQRMAFEFTDDFFREYMFQTDEVKQQFIWEVSHPMAEGYDIQACLSNIENSTVLSENEKHRLMKALNKYNSPLFLEKLI